MATFVRKNALPDGRILIANGPGDVTVAAGGTSAAIGTVPGIGNFPESGLLSLCADPAFATKATSTSGTRAAKRLSLGGSNASPAPATSPTRRAPT